MTTPSKAVRYSYLMRLDLTIFRNTIFLTTFSKIFRQEAKINLFLDLGERASNSIYGAYPNRDWLLRAQPLKTFIGE